MVLFPHKFSLRFMYRTSNNDSGVLTSPAYYHSFDDAMRALMVKRDLTPNLNVQYGVIEDIQNHTSKYIPFL
jgi:hypothetical protein